MRSKISILSNSKNINIKDSSLTVNVGALKQETLTLFLQEVAPNAVLNAGGRADEVRCYPGTREEVIGKIERWMDGQSEPDRRMLWLSGPAGAGKSSIAQTVTERATGRGIHSANFFFFRGDSTRDHAQPLVATLVYQLVELYPALRGHLKDILRAKPLAYKASLENQFSWLIASPLQSLQDSLSIERKIVLIIDGLDECDNEGAQVQILGALHALVSGNGSPFRVMVACRAEPHLAMFFNKIGGSVQSIFLNNDYKPEDDIRQFVTAKFDEIRRTHHLAYTLSKDWPVQSDIDEIIYKSSGQFIYAATVIRFIQYSKDSPALSLLAVVQMRPVVNHSPFAELDAIYSHIFSKARDIRVIKWALGLDSMDLNVYAGNILRTAGYGLLELQSLFADISTIARISIDPRGVLGVGSYHASLYDYLQDRTRAGQCYIDNEEVAVDLSTVCLQTFQNAESFDLVIKVMTEVDKPTAELSKSLLDASQRLCDERFGRPDNWYIFIATINRMYFIADKVLFRRMLRRWLQFAYIHKFNPTLNERWRDAAPYRYYKVYRFTEMVRFTLRRSVNR